MKIIFRKTSMSWWNWFHGKKICAYIFCNGKDFLVCFQSIVCYMSPSHFSLIVYSYPPPKIKQVIINIPMIYIIKKKKSTIFIILHFHCTETHWNFTGIKIFELILHWILVFILLFLGPNEDGTARAPRDGRFLKKYIENVLAS